MRVRAGPKRGTLGGRPQLVAPGPTPINDRPSKETLMDIPLRKICTWAGVALLGLATSSWAAAAAAAGARADAPDISGTYELVKRVRPDGKAASLSIVAAYTLRKDKYCEKSPFWLQNNLGTTGTSNEAPAAAQGCSA